ncbi:MAG: winged helix-turn-helix domain-containing protein [Candidatus Bathyarchaeota archaeon]|nr:winged helix-turn-helix domain-containing protein [Candidatus Bathyarchaeota archaeon]
MNYRDKLNITADILTVVSRNAKKTQIMYQANLSYKVMTRYLNEVVSASLVSFEPEHQCYVLTAKGKRFQTAYLAYLKNRKRIEKRLDFVQRQRLLLEEMCRSRKTDRLAVEVTK